MEEVIFSLDIYPIWGTLLWCFYPIGLIGIIKLLSIIFNNDYDAEYVVKLMSFIEG